MNDSRNVTQDGQKDVDKEIASASSLEEHTERWEDNGKTEESQRCPSEFSSGYPAPACREYYKLWWQTYMILQMSEAVKGMMIGFVLLSCAEQRLGREFEAGVMW